MAGAIIENMSSRKLAILGGILLVCQVCCRVKNYVMWRNISKKYTFWGQDPRNVKSEKYTIYYLSNMYDLASIQVLCFMVGAIFAPNPNNSDQFLATWCKVRNSFFFFLGRMLPYLMCRSFCYLSIVVMPECGLNRIRMGWVKASMSTRLGLFQGVKTSARYKSLLYRPPVMAWMSFLNSSPNLHPYWLLSLSWVR